MATDRVAFFESESWTVGIIGLGYVGLPLAVNAAERGLDVIGFDVSAENVSRLRSGKTHTEDVSAARLQACLDSDHIAFTADEEELKSADALIICVPSPLNRHREPDMSYIHAAAATVSRVVTPGTLVSLESTTYPGTTEDLLVPAATASGLELDVGVFVAFSPERVDPGNSRPLHAIPKVVGGVTATSGRVAAAAYSRIVDSVHLASSARAAEMTKLLENTYRSVNIGLINEMAMLAKELDIDIWEVVDAAATKPFGFQPFYPGPGVGGHCIPLDPHYLSWRAREAGFATRFIDLADQVNTRMPEYTVSRITELLNQAGRPVFGSKILGVGVAYKPNVGDDRESPSIEVLDLLRARGADIEVWDPLVDQGRLKERGFAVVDGPGSERPAIAVVLTDHDVIDYEVLADSVPIVFDTRGAYRKRGITRDNVVTL